MPGHHDPPETLDATPAGVAEPRRTPDGECILEGKGVAPGIAIGPVFLYARGGMTVEHRRLDPDEVEREVERFERAVERAERDLEKIITVARERLGETSAQIFDAQRLMLRDDQVYQAVLHHIRHDRCNADYAVKTVMTQHRRRLEASDSEYLRERANDLLDVQERLIRHLRRGKLLSSIDAETIVVAQTLTAADIVLFSRRQILGCAMDYGGPTSHVSIIARALGVPAVVGLQRVTERVQSGDTMILDGFEGRVIIHPTEDRLAHYRMRQERYRRLLQEQKSLIPLPAETLDGHRVTLRANLELEEELDLIEAYGADGIGLFRTEIQYLFTRRITPQEDDLYHQYRRIVEHVAPAVTTFRLLDMGGDKMLPMSHREHNPFLGWRGLRILLDRPELLHAQLRAILRAGAHGPTRLLVPMVTTLPEWRRLREHLAEVQDRLRHEGLPFAEQMPLGVMIEVPAAALMAEHLAAEADFLSIGTNDLTQYTLAVDRGNDLVAGLFQELHPAVLALIQKTVEGARRHGIPVSVCGEMAGDPRATAVLVGLGVSELSAVPAALPGVKRVIRAMNLDEARTLATQALQEIDAEAVRGRVETWLKQHGCGLLHDLNASEPAS